MGMSRSEQMRRIRSENTSPELLLRSALWQRGVRYRLNYRTPIGRPDIVIPRRRIAIFVDGCFWHGCPDHYSRPRASEPYWAEKLRSNIERDIRQTAVLEEQGWRVIRIWEHQVRYGLPEAVNLILGLIETTPQNIPTSDWRVISVSAHNSGEGIEKRTLIQLRNPGLTLTIYGPRVTGRIIRRQHR